jgi:TolB-like protein/DNA-binding winged helix-turn-helix (wHTH) protein
MAAPVRPTQAIRFGDFEADLQAGQLRKHGVRIKLQEQPFQILAMMLERPRGVVTREELRQRLWPADTFVDFDHGLNNAINRLREALNDSADAPRFIETLPRRGYRFIGEVESKPVSGSQPGTARELAAALPQESAGRHSPSPRRIAWVASVGAGLVLAAGLAWGLVAGRPWPFRSNAAMKIHSVAVLPLDNLSGDLSQEYFADEITDALTTSLAEMRGIRVISRTSAMHYKRTKKLLPEIAKELGVDAVVEGSASRAGGVVHVNAQLIYVPGDSHIWAHSYEGASSGLAAIESEIANDIARKIGTTARLESSKDLSGAVSVPCGGSSSARRRVQPCRSSRESGGRDQKSRGVGSIEHVYPLQSWHQFVLSGKIRAVAC